MLIVFPLGLLATSLVWDLGYLGSGNRMWGQLAFWTIIAGIIGAILAAVPGFIDWLGIAEGTRAKKVGLYHLALNLLLLALFIISAATRWSTGYETPRVGEMILSWIGIALAIVSGWFGGELVERLGVAVYPDANVDAPSSLATDLRAYDRTERRVPPVGPTEPTPA